MASAAERLAERIKNERQRRDRYRDNQLAAGKKQVNIWLAPDDLTLLRQIQEAAGGVPQGEAIALAIRKATS